MTRYIALISMISVMLGVATMIVTNAVMLGFANEMQIRIHGILADVTFQSTDLNKGFPDYQWHRQEILKAAGDLIEEMTPAVVVPGMLTYRPFGSSNPISMPVDIVGIEPESQSKVNKIAQYLQHPVNRQHLTFHLHQGGYDIQSSGGGESPYRFAMRNAGWEYRRQWAAKERWEQEQRQKQQAATPAPAGVPQNPFDTLPQEQQSTLFDPARQQHAGIIVGVGIATPAGRKKVQDETGKDIIIEDLFLRPGDDVMLTFPTADLKMQFQNDSFTVVDIYDSKMVEYDMKFVFVPIEKLQTLRGMVDADSGHFTVTQILIKGKPGVNIDEIRDKLQKHFPPQWFTIETWRDKQELLLKAVFNEVMMLNVILSMVMAVAGFGILAIFYMIVIEKQKDIGILKALGASSGGVMQIFLYYSLLLGMVGSLLGLGLGLLIVDKRKEVAAILSYMSGSNVFSPEVYSFYEVPAIVHPATVAAIMAGAVVIAVAAGVLPALRAARVHPVETLRS